MAENVKKGDGAWSPAPWLYWEEFRYEPRRESLRYLVGALLTGTAAPAPDVVVDGEAKKDE